MVSDTEAARWKHTKVTTWVQNYLKLQLQVTFLFKMVFKEAFISLAQFSVYFGIDGYQLVSTRVSEMEIVP